MKDARKSLIFASALSTIITFIVYLPSLTNGFVLWDDPKYVIENEWIREFDLAFLREAFTEVYFSNWHPLTMISYAVDYALWGLNPLGYHLENTIIHTINTALVAVLSIRLISIVRPLSAPAAFAAGFVPALFFGIHPLHVESVAWISERKDVLCAMFFMTSILFYLKYAQKGKALCYILSLLSFALAIMSKSMAVTLPAVLLLIDFYPLRRLSGAKGVLKAVAEKAPFIAVSAFASIIAIYSQSAAVASLAAAPLDVRVLTALKAYSFYLEKLFIPLGLAPYYPYQAIPDPLAPEYLITYGLLAGISSVCLAFIRYRAFIVVWLYFLGTLVPVIGLVQVGVQAAADRYMYLPSLSLLVLLGAGMALFIEKNSKSVVAVMLGFISVAAVGLSYATVTQAAIWKDSITLWDHTLGLYPDAGQIAYVNRGVAYKKAGRYKEALSDLNAAIKIKPTATAYADRGNVRKKLGDKPGAVEDYRKALEYAPQDGAIYFNIALVLEETSNIEGAIENAEKAARLGVSQAGEYLQYLKGRYR